MDAENPVLPLKGKSQVRITFTSKVLTSSLEKHGVTYRKSLTMGNIIQNIPENIKHHFIRGYFDGDGSIVWTKTGGGIRRPYVSFVGTYEFLLPIKNYLHGGSLFKDSKSNIWRLTFGAKRDVLWFKDFIYTDANYFLERKKERFPE